MLGFSDMTSLAWIFVIQAAFIIAHASERAQLHRFAPSSPLENAGVITIRRNGFPTANIGAKT